MPGHASRCLVESNDQKHFKLAVYEEKTFVHQDVMRAAWLLTLTWLAKAALRKTQRRSLHWPRLSSRQGAQMCHHEEAEWQRWHLLQNSRMYQASI